MLKSISIKNFKSVKDLNLDLGRLNIFIGENGCGKTSILEALAMASASFSNKLDQEFLVSRGIRVTEPKLMKSAFEKADEQNQIELGFVNTEDNFFNYKIEYKGRELSIADSDTNLLDRSDSTFKHYLDLFAEHQSEKIKSGKTAPIKKGVTRAATMHDFLGSFNDYLNMQWDLKTTDLLKMEKEREEGVKKDFNIGKFLIYTPENYFLRRFEEEGQISPVGVRGEGLFKHLTECFTDAEFVTEIVKNLKLINWFDDLDIPKDLVFNEMRLNIKDRFIKETIEHFDQRSANEGFLYLLFYFTVFLSKDTPDFFAIDNIDNALNPKLCKELISRLAVLAEAKEKQVILSTHNPAILDGLDLSDDQQRLFVVFRNSEGHTKVKRVKPPRPIEGIETVRLSEAFIRGYLGGLPKNF